MSSLYNKSVKRKTSSAGLLRFPSGHDDVENIDPCSRTFGKRGTELPQTGEPGPSKGRTRNAPSRLPCPKDRYPLRTIPWVSSTTTVMHDNSSPNIENSLKVSASQKNIKRILPVTKTEHTTASKRSLSKTDDAPKSVRKAKESFQPIMSSGTTEVAQDLYKHVTYRRHYDSPCDWNISSVNACALISDNHSAPKVLKIDPKNTLNVPKQSETDNVNSVRLNPNKCSTPLEEQTESIENNNNNLIHIKKQDNPTKDVNNNHKYLPQQISVRKSYFKHVTCRRVFTPTDWPPCEPVECAADEVTNACGTRTHVTQFLRRERLLPEDEAGPSNTQPAFTPSQDPDLFHASINETTGPTYTPYAPVHPQHCPVDTYRPKRVKFSLARTRSRERNKGTLSTPPSPQMPSFRTAPLLPRRGPSLSHPSPPADMPTLIIYEGLPEVSNTLPQFSVSFLSELANNGMEPGIVNFDDKAPPMDKVLLYSFEYIECIMLHLQRREVVWQQSEPNPTHTISEINRSILVNWLVKLNSHMKGDAGLLEASVRLVDRALAVKLVPLHALQLLGTACYWIARKQFAARPGAASRLVRYCNGAYTPPELIAEEIRIMRTLNWPSLPPSSDSWVHYLVLRARARDATLVAQAAHYLLCGAMLHAGLASVKPSLLANAGVTAALHLLEGRRTPDLVRCAARHDDSPCVNQGHYSSSLVCDLFHVARKLCAPDFMCREPYLVYSHPSRLAVAQCISAALDRL